MRFGPLPPRRAAGAVLAHTLRLGDETFRKGVVLSEEDAEALVAAGIDEVTVAVLEEGDVSEDEAAAALAGAARGPGLRLRGPFTGRCNLMSERAGLVRVDEGAVGEANAVDEALTLATVPNWARVAEDALVATAKVIPLAVDEGVLGTAVERLRRAIPVLEVLPFLPRRGGLVLTTLPGDAGRLRDRAERVTRHRLQSLGSSMEAVLTVPHDVGAVAGALDELRERGCDLLLVLGASAVVDRADVVPAAVERAGGQVQRLGIPVDPGNLLLLARLGGDPVLGVPGCARSSRRSGFDTVLERLAVGVSPTAEELARLGVGGLLREIPTRPQPRSPMASDPEAHADRGSPRSRAGPEEWEEGHPRVAGLILAAGRSRRMGPLNKVLAEVDGTPMVIAAIRSFREAGVDPVLVVTGHEADEIEAALAGAPVEVVRNPRYEDGMGTSVAEGVAALEEIVDGVLIGLADMPRVSADTVRRLLQAFEAAAPGDASVWVPVHRGKRGNPVLWSAFFFPELETLAGDIGGRALLSDHAEAVHEVPVDDPGVLLDVDTRDALDRARSEGSGADR